ncbi:Uncharacterized protein conserved in bacteria [Shigella sonnei]|nr:Uncharacterized protein conserved in bacteria [Shigella sonnei]
MSIQNEMPGYNEMNQYLNQQGTGLTPAEMHGLISGMICGGNDDSSWLPLLHDLTNEGMAFGHELAQALRKMHSATRMPCRMTASFFSFICLMAMMSAFSIGLMHWQVGSITSCLVLALRNRSWIK